MADIITTLILDKYIAHGYNTVRLDIKATYGVDRKINQIINEKEEENKQIEDNKLLWLDPNIREKTCVKVDELEEGTRYLITHLIKKESAKKTKFIFKIENDDNIYISTSFMEETILERQPLEKFYNTIGTKKRDKAKMLHNVVYI